jgi:catalase
MRTAYVPHAEDNDFIQPGNLYRTTLSDTDREHLVNNIVGHMSEQVERPVQERALKLWYQVDRNLGSRIAKGLGITLQETEQASAG